MAGLIDIVRKEKDRIARDCNAILNGMKNGRYHSPVELARALNGAARSGIAKQIQDEYRAKGGS